ncbi:MAG: hypothetical protein K2N65_00255 [Anaeroplasmataceae bacterium]|nr:hypothetical protein [Anaeroplasmataceae bacterium]
MRAISLILISIFSFTACTNQNIKDNDTDDGGTNTPTIATDSKILIVYFSCTNTTATIAKHIETKTGGALYEILPEVPYTADDLKYYTNCRADKEQADSSARPAIRGSIENIDLYNVIFLGYPIWHGQAPRIISTFLESYDFSDKKIIPFCTSQSSGIGNSDTNLHSLAPSAEWVSGKRFSSNDTQNKIGEWIDTLNLEVTPNKPTETEQPNVQEEITKMYITINGNKIEVTLIKNSSVDALVELLKQGDITYTASDYGDFEKVGSLGHTLPTNNSQITTEPGDVILYSGNQIVLFYGSNSWSYTRLGKINGYSVSELETLLGAGKGSTQVTISLK